MTVPSSLFGNDEPVPLPDWDPQVIVQLLGNNPARNQRLLGMFLVTAADTLACMQHALEEGNLTELTRLAHGLKSSARSVGAMALGEQCAVLEKASPSVGPAGCKALLSGVEARLATVKRLIQSSLWRPV
jgi:HPt (histidine-containing phosphotransfer) domain-containing protein